MSVSQACEIEKVWDIFKRKGRGLDQAGKGWGEEEEAEIGG